MNKPSAIAGKSFRAMKANTSKERSFYTQGQRFVARVLLAVWLLASFSPEGVLAIPKRQPAMVPATTASPQGPSLASAPSTLPPGGIFQLPPDSPSAFWGGSVATSPSIDTALQQRMSQEALPFIERDLLRNSPKVTSVAENLSCQARGGESVRFHYQMGQWRAEVSSHIGAFSRRAVLPVVCSQDADVTSSLELLSRSPSWYSQRQIHVLDRNVCPTLGEVVYVGELGLKGGGEGEASGNDAPQDEASTPAEQGDVELKGTDFYEQALATATQCHGPNHLETAKALNNLKNAYENLGNYPEALEYYQQALKMYQALHEGENHADVA